MAETKTEREPLDDQAAARLAEFARGCKAAARAVSLYPDGHPSVQSSLQRMVEVGRKATLAAPLELTILPDQLLLGGRAAEKPDTATPELAALFHRHQIGRFVLNDGADNETWLTFFRLLSRPAEDVRDDGGIEHLWGDAGGVTTVQQRVSVVLREVDYEKILRSQGDGEAALEALIEGCLGDTPSFEFDDATRAAMIDTIGSEAKLAAVAAELRARADDEDGTKHAGALFQFMTHAASVLDPSDPTQVNKAFGNLATVVGDLPAESMTELLDRQSSPEATVGGINVVSAAVGHMSDETIANFVANSVIAQGGATQRLAEAFSALVPDIDSRRQLLSLAEHQVSESPVGTEDDFPDVWRRTEEMLTSYRDEQYVGAEYARELSQAREQAVEVDALNDDPPERVASWLETVNDGRLRDLDLQLLLDLLELEADAFRWRDLTVTVAETVEELTRRGDVPIAVGLVERLAAERGDADEVPADEESKRAFALQTLDRIAAGPTMRHALGHLKDDAEEVSTAVGTLCTVLGPAVVTSLAEVLASEQDSRTRRRIRDILLGFGKKGREAVRQLLNAPNWEVRQTAAFLLREFGGTEGLPELERLLTDSEPLVQREAIRAVVLIGDERTYGALVRVLTDTKSRNRSRNTLIQQLTSQRDARAVPLCSYLIAKIDHRTLVDVFMAAIETLGNIGSDEVVPPLRDVLYSGEWWAPLRTRALRKAAALALRRSKNDKGSAVLREAASSGSRGVRRAARVELTQLTR